MKRHPVRHLLAWTVLSCLFACTDMAVVQEPVDCEPVPQPSFEYRFAIADSLTKATLSDEGVFWEEGDAVGLFAGSGASRPAGVDVTTTPKTIVFTAGEPLAAGTPVYAYYPYQEGNSSATATRVTFASSQRGASRSAMPMTGIPTSIGDGEGHSGVIHFLNLGSVIDFRVFSSLYSGETVRAVYFNVTEGTNPICGEACLDLTGVTASDTGSLELTWPEGPAVSSVKLVQTATVAATKDEAAEDHLYLVVPPGTYSGTFVVVTNEARYTFHTTGKVFNRNGLKRMNLNLDNAEREAIGASYVKIQSASELAGGGTFLIVYENGPYAFKPVASGTGNLLASSGNLFRVTRDGSVINGGGDVDACQVVFEPASGGNYYMKAAALGKYFYPSGSSIAASDTPRTSVAVTVNGGTVNITAGSNNYFKYSTYIGYFRGSTSNSSRELALYKLQGMLQSVQNLQFSAASFTFLTEDCPLPVSNVAGAPVLTGATTPVRYYCSNPAVASVEPYTGALTILGEGSATITAVAEEDDCFYGATASYTLEVHPELTYQLVNDAMNEYFLYEAAHPYTPSDNNSWVEEFARGKSSTNRLDWPKPVPLTWEASVSGTPTVEVYNDADCTSEEIMAYVTNTTANSADIYNLIPGRKYWYVVRSGGTRIAEGHFRTQGRRRIIRVAESPSDNSYANNCRDFGGLTTADGRVVRYGKIFRGSNMDRTSSNGQKDYILNKMKVELDVDLRNSPVTSPNGSNMYNGLGLAQIPKTNANVYKGHTQEEYNSINDLTNRTNMGASLTRIMNAAINNSVAYIHCKVGADRTGFTCLMLEAVLGVDPELCDIDYELTSFFAALDGGTYRKRKVTTSSWFYYPQGVDFINQKSGATFQERAVNYVTSTFNVPIETIRAFQEAMLADPEEVYK